ncbi:MAG: hypothetical protein QGH20_08040 [Candidatus Latescibacteria bacterium]|nr:hypothetical protein [Candidatus Latescibacterota bacterium]
MYSANEQGFRAQKEYALRLSPDRIRIASLGDSFTHGDDVSDSAAWTAVLDRSEDNIEVLNFGVGAYGLNQALLRYCCDGAKFLPNIVMIGFVRENINRNVNVFRFFYSPVTMLPFTKPRFVLSGDSLRLVRNSFQTLSDYRDLLGQQGTIPHGLSDNDAFSPKHRDWGVVDWLPSVQLLKFAIGALVGRPAVYSDESYNQRFEAFKVTTRLCDLFWKTAKGNGSIPIFVVFPDWTACHRHKSGGPTVYGSLLDHLRKKGYRYVDVLDAFIERAPDASVEELFIEARSGHYTPFINSFVAAHLLAYLRREGLTGPATVKSMASSTQANTDLCSQYRQ